MDYHANTGIQLDTTGNLQSITPNLPKDLALPALERDYTLLDVFPAFEKDVMP
jgi:hypothetical protein